MPSHSSHPSTRRPASSRPTSPASPSSIPHPPPSSTTTSTRPRGYPKPLGVGRGFPILSRGRYLHSTPVSLSLSARPRSDPAYVIRDADNPTNKRFTVSAAHRALLLAQTRTLHDAASGAPLCRAQAAAVSARGTVTIFKPDGRPLLTLRRGAVVGRGKSTVVGFICGRERRAPDLTVQMRRNGKKFTFIDRRSLDIAEVRRVRTGENGVKYTLHVSPGYDAALFVMCVVCVHEAWNG